MFRWNATPGCGMAIMFVLPGVVFHRKAFFNVKMKRDMVFNKYTTEITPQSGYKVSPSQDNCSE